jgi:hypothetical protein
VQNLSIYSIVVAGLPHRWLAGLPVRFQEWLANCRALPGNLSFLKLAAGEPIFKARCLPAAFKSLYLSLSKFRMRENRSGEGVEASSGRWSPDSWSPDSR